MEEMDSDIGEEIEVVFEKFGSRSKKRALCSDSEDEYVPPIEKPKKKTKVSEKSSPVKRPIKKEKIPKEKKPKAERKKPTKKVKIEVQDVISSQNSIDVPDGSIQCGSGLQQHSVDIEQIKVHIASNVIRLLDEKNTIPFIARYRNELTDNMSPEKLREVMACYEMVTSVKQKASTVMKSIAKLEKLTPVLEKSIRCARSVAELDHIYSPYKPGSKRTLAERARQLGLEDPAVAVLVGTKFVYIDQLLNPQKKGLEKLSDIELGIQHIIADIISKDKDVLDFLRKVKEAANFLIESSKARATTAKESKDSKKTVNAEPKKEADHKHHHDKVDNESKFERYFKFSLPVKYIRPHQVLALNRGKNLKVLSVKIVVPDFVLGRLKDFCYKTWLSKGANYSVRNKLVNLSIEDCYTRLIQPLITRQIMAELTSKAEHAAVEVFATNLKKLLLMPPLRGDVVLGIDPGFRNGCKIGVSSSTGSVLATDVIYPNFGKKIPPPSDQTAVKLKDLLMRFSASTEKAIDLTYCLTAALQVSLARRLQDPLGELVKVEPKHLGVGMYQHDVPEKQLNSTLDEVVTELNPETARNKSAEPSGSSLSKKKMSDEAENPLDRTWIHPESYSVAVRFIEKCQLRLEDLGTPNFINKVRSTVARKGLNNMAEEFGVAEPVMKLISEGLQQAPDHDIRSEFQKPLFRSSVSTIEELTVGEVLTGSIMLNLYRTSG
ncbi:hypothetical protein C0J52_02903 [Blattella germanica]|nr:hypothetical protein C0J52_02903 [Blattella germanica]